MRVSEASRQMPERMKPQVLVTPEASAVKTFEGVHPMNANAKPVECNLEDATTPEEIFSLPDNVPLNQDVLNTFLGRAIGLAVVLQGGALPTHEKNVLWLLESQLSQMKTYLDRALCDREAA